MADVKITVLKKTLHKDLCDRYTEGVRECDMLKLGDEYIVRNLKMPDGFCSWAWADIQRDIAILAFNGEFPQVKEKGVGISCCTDGFRPVIFKIERISA